MTIPLTNVLFAQQIGFMAKDCASWSTSMLTPSDPEKLGQPVKPSTLDRFIQKMTERLDDLRDWGSPDGGKEGAHATLYRHALCGIEPSHSVCAVLVQRDLGVWKPSDSEPGRWIWNRERLAQIPLADLRALYHTITSDAA